MDLGVYWPTPLNNAMQRVWIPLEHCITTDPYVPALCCTEVELEMPAQSEVR